MKSPDLRRGHYRYSLLQTLCLLLLCASAAACAAPAQPGDPGLLARLSFSRSQLIIDNGNDFVWNRVTIRLNGDYVYATDILPRGASSLPLSEFRAPGGAPFDPLRSTPHRLTIQVEEGFDRKPMYWEWR